VPLPRLIFLDPPDIGIHRIPHLFERNGQAGASPIRRSYHQLGSTRLDSAFIPLEVARVPSSSPFSQHFSSSRGQNRAITRWRESSSRSLFLSAVVYRTSCGQQDREIRLFALSVARCKVNKSHRNASCKTFCPVWFCIKIGRPRHNIVKCRSRARIEIPFVRVGVSVAVATVVIIAVYTNIQEPPGIGCWEMLMQKTICVSLYVR